MISPTLWSGAFTVDTDVDTAALHSHACTQLKRLPLSRDSNILGGSPFSPAFDELNGSRAARTIRVALIR